MRARPLGAQGRWGKVPCLALGRSTITVANAELGADLELWAPVLTNGLALEEGPVDSQHGPVLGVECRFAILGGVTSTRPT
jgi:hypothetical protein